MSTSIDSYFKCHEDGLIGEKQYAVLGFILATQEQFPEGHSRGDVGRHFDDPNTGYQRRLQELERLGILTCTGTKYDSITNRDVKTYEPTGIVPLVRRPVDATVTYITCLCVPKSNPNSSPYVQVFPKKQFRFYTKQLVVLEAYEVFFKNDKCPDHVS